ncbi:MAG: NADP-dependent oxidoreductase, partial [Chitinophagaceae bacterium]
MKTKQIVLAKRPIGVPDKDAFRIEETELPTIGDGQVLVKSLYYSVDPYMRGRMNDRKSYAPPFNLNEPIIGGIIGEVIESNTPELKPGFIVTGRLPWKEQFVIDAASLKEIEKDDAVPLSAHLGVLGMPGLTAYVGMVLIGRPAKGETVVISGAAGAVGSAAGQIAKIFGCKVIGIAGSDEKCKVLTDEFGFDAAINYKTEKELSKALAVLCPKGVDIYFDNVGGEIS